MRPPSLFQVLAGCLESNRICPWQIFFCRQIFEILNVKFYHTTRMGTNTISYLPQKINLRRVQSFIDFTALFYKIIMSSCHSYTGYNTVLRQSTLTEYFKWLLVTDSKNILVVCKPSWHKKNENKHTEKQKQKQIQWGKFICSVVI